jgi:hypothetical protein
MHNANTLFETLGLSDASRANEREEQNAYRITEPDPELQEAGLQWTPELTLMLAILEDAVACFCKTLKRPRQNPDILARQAEFWIRLEDWDSPFSFNNICEALQLEPHATRDRILRRRRQLESRAA